MSSPSVFLRVALLTTVLATVDFSAPKRGTTARPKAPPVEAEPVVRSPTPKNRNRKERRAARSRKRKKHGR